MARVTFYLLVVILCVVFNHGFAKDIKNQLNEEMDQQAPELPDEEILKFNDVDGDDDDNDDGEFSDDIFGNKGKTGLKDSINSLPILSSSLSEDEIAEDKDIKDFKDDENSIPMLSSSLSKDKITEDKDVKDFKDGENSLDEPEDNLKNDELLQHPNVGITLKKNALVKTLPLMTPYYEISFSMKLLYKSNGIENIIHLTTGGNHGKPGYRNPGIWLHGGTKMDTCTTISSKSRCWMIPFHLPIGKFVHIKIRQEAIGGQLYFFVYFNDIELTRIYSNKAYTFRNVKVYAGDPWYPSAKAVIKNFRFKNLISQDLVTTLKKNALFKTLPLMTPYYEVSFFMKLLYKSNGIENIIHLTTGGDDGKPGYRNPGIWLHGGTKMDTCTTISSKRRCWTIPFHLPIDKFMHIKIRQEAIGGHLYFLVYYNDIELTRIYSNTAYTFQNVKVYAGDPWWTPAKAAIKNFRFKNLIPQDDLIQKSRIFQTHKVITPFYEISFEVKPIVRVAGLTSILHHTTGEDNGNGGRIPAVFFQPGTSKMLVCSCIGKDNNSCWTSHDLPYGKFSKVTISQRDINGKLNFSVFIDGREHFNIHNTIPRTFLNVKVYSGDRWYPAAEAILRNYKFKNLEKPIATVSKGRIIETIDFQSSSYELTFEIKPITRIGVTTNVLHLTTGSKDDRIPAVFILGGSSRMHICSMISNNKNYCWDSAELSFSKYSHVKITQRPINGSFFYMIFIDGKQVFKIQNNTPKRYMKVIVYAADNWFNAAKAVVKNFKFRNIA